MVAEEKYNMVTRQAGGFGGGSLLIYSFTVT